MDDPVTVLAQVCLALSSDSNDAASRIIREEYPFSPLPRISRRYGPHEATRVFVRDGFIDRYTGTRLIFPPVLRAISVMLPEGFPYHPNWKMDATHPAYWDLTATIDHLIPVARGGADNEGNWVTTSMARNSAKGNWSLDDLGWTLQPVGDFHHWDGLLGWFVEFTNQHPETLVDNAMKQWRIGAVAALA